MSQSDFLVFVVQSNVINNQDTIYNNAIKLMEIVVKNPDRLHKSAFGQDKKGRPKLTKLAHVEVKGWQDISTFNLSTTNTWSMTT